MRILLLGCEGLLGTTMRATAAADPRVTSMVALGHGEIDITDREQVRRAVREVRPDACVNTAALMPADLCDQEAERAYAVNTLGPRWVSQSCAEVGAVPVYISTDFVFDGQGTRAYRPDDLPRPVQTYGITKLAGEHETRLGSDRHLIARTACLFGPPPVSPTARASFVDRVAAAAAAGNDLKIVDNVVMSPTFTGDLATTVLDLLHHGADSGVYHVVNQGSTSWYRLCVAVLERLGIDAQVTPVEEQFTTTAPRPHHTPLAGELPEFARRIRRPWEAALDEYLGVRRAG
ncbi:dTDP-4-dehydrorhamnose reductase [Kitasatospora sp. NBC_01560]|uniref:dTDP-4-dehydrorhamnose reductase n=1 Tax=Kitasatospora sp. NBC_01560 TaxID=2975965 RepID=UPI003870350C